MKNIKTILLSLSLIISSSAFSQLKFGIKAGYNLSETAYWTPDVANLGLFFDMTKMKSGYQFGALMDYSINDALSLRPEILISNKGYSYDIPRKWGDNSEGYDRVSYNYFEIPVNLAFKLNDFQIFVGPFMSFGLGGKHAWEIKRNGRTFKEELKVKHTYKEVSIDDSSEDEIVYFQAFDFGLNGGIGYTFGPVLVNAGYSLGLGNLTPKEEGSDFEPKDHQQRNRLFFLSVAYLFGE